jgi:hypothetical protein
LIREYGIVTKSVTKSDKKNALALEPKNEIFGLEYSGTELLGICFLSEVVESIMQGGERGL